jgi:uncharacterized membrane protein (UPF0127 family)
MSKKNNLTDQQKKNKPKSRHRMQIGISFTVIVIALVVIFMPKKIENHTTVSTSAPMFTKQGELTLINSNDKPIVSIDIEIADDDAKREVGMMGRPIMDERQGMLFIYEEEQLTPFWMRNTILSLDMIFINKQRKIITIHKNTKPFSDDTYSPTAMTMFVLEVNAGFTEKYGIKEGDMVSWKKL